MIENIEISTERSHLWKRKATLMIVDDDHSIRRICKAYLESKGFEVHLASSAAEGLEILDRIRVDLVITNIRMPGIDGLELTRLIKDKYDSDVIIMTGYHSYNLEEAIRIGADGLLHKPATLEELLSSINSILIK